MAKASRLVAKQTNDISDLRLLVLALCKKNGIDPEKVLAQDEEQTSAPPVEVKPAKKAQATE
jgi:hypothetical protein